MAVLIFTVAFHSLSSGLSMMAVTLIIFGVRMCIYYMLQFLLY